jgi:hypothetical protein
MIESEILLVAMKTATLTFGGLLTYLSYQAYRRTGSAALRALVVGIGLVTVGAILGGALHQFGNVTLEWSASVQSVFTATGFAVLTYSLYTERVSDERGRDDQRAGDRRRHPNG